MPVIGRHHPAAAIDIAGRDKPLKPQTSEVVLKVFIEIRLVIEVAVAVDHRAAKLLGVMGQLAFDIIKTRIKLVPFKIFHAVEVLVCVFHRPRLP